MASAPRINNRSFIGFRSVRLDDARRSVAGCCTQGGMSLIEVMVALVILGLTSVALMGLFLAGGRSTAVARHDVAAVNVAQEILEEIKSVPWNQIGTAQEAGSDWIKLNSTAGNEDGKYLGYTIALTRDKGAGQVRQVVGYSGNTATVHPSWDEVPINTTRYILFPWPVSGKAQGGSLTTIVLDSSASQEDGYYNGYLIAITGGNGSGQWRKVISYVGRTRAATVNQPWSTVPDSTSKYRMVKETCPYKVFEKASSGELITFEVAVPYQDRGQPREVSLVTDKLRR